MNNKQLYLMNKNRLTIALLLACLFPHVAKAIEQIKVEVTTNRTAETKISPYIYGNFIEAGFGRQVSGMWSEMIYNRGFALQGSYPRMGQTRSTTQWWMFPESMYNANAPFWHTGYEECDWEVTDKALITMSRTHGTESFKGTDALQLTKQNEKRAGIMQKGIYLEKGKEYQFYLLGGVRTGLPKVSVSLPGFKKVNVQEGATLPLEFVIREEANPKRILFRKEFHLKGYEEYHRCIIPDLGFTGRTVVEFAYSWKGNVALSCCSLMPSDNVLGWRKDVVELLRDIKVPVIRYPGGCYASFYDWRNYVGPRDSRPVSHSYYWGGLDDNDAFIDEFLQLCDIIGCEPQICINMMTSTPYKIAEFVEYLNGDDNTPMGRFRKENGVTRKRKVRLFEMDNEAGRKWTALQYAEKVAEFGKAMKAVDTNIELMMMAYSFTDEMEYLEQMLQLAGPYIDYVIHRNAYPPFVNRMLRVLKKYNDAYGRNIRLVNTEWLASGDSPEPFSDKKIPQRFGWKPQEQDSYKKVLSFRQIHWFYALNGASTLLDFLSFGGNYYLANFNNCVNTWGQNVIESSKERTWLSPMGEVFKFFVNHDDCYPLESRLYGTEKGKSEIKEKIYNDSEVDFPLIVNRQSQTELYKAMACETQNGINLYLVNKADQPIQIHQLLPKDYKPISIETLYAPDRLSRTYLSHSEIETETKPIKGRNVTLRPLSVNRIIIKKQ